jgi:SAM-dependent methyltransferase
VTAELLERHVERFNAGVAGGDFGPMVAGFAPDAELVFDGVPFGPFQGRAAIANAYQASPPDDRIELLEVSERDDGAVAASYAWLAEPGVPAGWLLLRARDGLISRLVVQYGTRGTGPGAITPDGCAVELYALLPAAAEPGIVHAAVGQGASILELGAGAGRVTHPLLALGHRVVAVDESAAMLARVRGARTVQAGIEELDLGERLDAVLLASHLVNTADDAQRRAFLATCERHVRPGGAVLAERHPPAWFDQAGPERSTVGAVTYVLDEVERPGPDLVSARVAYELGGRRWTQRFSARRLDDDQVAAALAEAGLRLDAWVTPDRAWLRAVPA